LFGVIERQVYVGDRDLLLIIAVDQEEQSRIVVADQCGRVLEIFDLGYEFGEFHS